MLYNATGQQLMIELFFIMAHTDTYTCLSLLSSACVFVLSVCVCVSIRVSVLARMRVCVHACVCVCVCTRVLTTGQMRVSVGQNGFVLHSAVGLTLGHQT